MSLKRELERLRAPDEAGAAERAWTVVQSAYGDRASPGRRTSRARMAIPALAVLAGVLALALSPAGATVRRWIGHALGIPHPAAALFSLPAPGRLLVAGPGGTWTIAADGSTRRLGAWRQASWSPHGRFLAVVGGDHLAAVDPRGTPRWTLARPGVSNPRWYPPTGFRIAYLSRHDLRVVAGDGTGDHLLAADAAPAASAWRPGHPYQLAYVDGAGSVVVRDADSGRVSWTVRPSERPRELAWSSGGDRLLVVARTHARVYDRNGRPMATIGTPPDTPILDGSLSPDGRTLALVRGGAAEDVVLASLVRGRPRLRLRLRRVLSGSGLQQLAWSPDARWLLVSWPPADQWVFVRVSGRPRIAAVSRIARQFTFGSAGRGSPRLEGWCCTAQGAPG
ncbi:MAG: WD40 repeat domain-containing protein [Actinomycetota bacterium]|nr:WD40 repeat domain-containing protein [Actinomycetota bacterium]